MKKKFYLSFLGLFCFFTVMAQFTAQIPPELATAVSPISSKVTSTVMVNRPASGTGGIISTEGTTGGLYSADFFATVDEAILDEVVFYGFQAAGGTFPSSVVSFNVAIYQDTSGKPGGKPTLPGTGVLELLNLPSGKFTYSGGTFTVNITSANGGVPVTLPAGDYWIVAFPSVNGDPGSAAVRWNWREGAAVPVHSPMLIDPENLFNAGATDWTPLEDLGVQYSSMAWKLTGEFGSCTGSPEGGVASVTPAAGSPGSSYVVRASGMSLGDGLEYIWESNRGSGWQPRGTASSTFSNYSATALPNIGDTEQWRLKTTCLASGQSSYSSVATFTTQIIYCAASATTVEAITNVTFAGINNTSPKNGPGYENFTTIEGQVAQGEVSEFSAQGDTDGPYTSHFTVWIDWNQNGVFDADEKTDIGSITGSTGTDGKKATKNIVVPGDAKLGKTRMRVRKNYNVPASSPCGNLTFGQVEDYTIEVKNSACPAPSDVELLARTSNVLQINWSPGASETSWNISFGPYGYSRGGSGEMASQTVNNPIFVYAGLTPYTKYQFYVQAVCGPSNTSPWIGPLTVTTLGAGIGDGVLSQSIGDLGTDGVSCTGGDNWWMRSYSLDDHGITSPILLTGMEFGISNINATEELQFYAFNHPGFPDGFNITNLPAPLASGTMTVGPGDEGQKLRVLFDSPAVAEAGSTIVVAVVQPTASGVFLYLSTTADDMVTSYLAAGECEISVPESVAAVGFPDARHLINLVGEKIDYLYSSASSWTPGNPDGLSTATDNIVLIDGNASLGASTDANNLTVLGDASLNISNVLNVNGDLRMLGDVVFKSTSTTDGELGEIKGIITGEATVERYMQNRRSYRMVSSPVTTTTSIHANWQEGATSRTDDPNPGYGTHITGTTDDQFNGFDATQTGNASMWTVDIAGQKFDAIANTDVNTLTAGDAYLMYIRGGRHINLDSNESESATTLRAKGTLSSGVRIMSFATVNAGDFAMFGNQYQSAVDVNALFAGAINVNTNHFYVYDPSRGDYGSYVTVTLPAGTSNLGSTANEYLQPGQAAQFATLAVGPASVTFTEAAKAPGHRTNTNATGGFNAAGVMDVQLFTAANYAEGKAPHDGFVMLFDSAHTNAVTPEDAIKPMNFAENFGIDNNGKYLSIEKREMPVASEVYQLYSTGYKHGKYTIHFDIKGLEDTFFYLDDAYTGSSTLLNADTAYTFEVSDATSKATNRFSIRVESRLGVEDHALSGIRLFPNPTNSDSFNIYAPHLNGATAQVRIADVSGREIYSSEVRATDNKMTVTVNETLASGIYLVTVTSAGEAQTFRLIRE